ncbi:MAG: hypothetical protein ACI4S2_07015 [Lachnospiraceae bacterium]
MKKNKGIICLSILLFIFLLSGCESGMTEEERCEKIVEKYVDEHTPDFTYEVKEEYSAKENTCQAMIDLAVWEYEKDREILEVFSYDGDNIYTEKEYDETETELDKYVASQRNFTSIGNMWRFDEERDLLRKQCKQCYAMYLQKIVNASCEEQGVKVITEICSRHAIWI